MAEIIHTVFTDSSANHIQAWSRVIHFRFANTAFRAINRYTLLPEEIGADLIREQSENAYPISD